MRLIAVATRKEKIFLDCYLHTAARRSEIFRWTWHEDINFEKRQIRLGTRKTRDGSMEYEWLPMNDELYKSLMWLWENRNFKRNPYVFVCETPGRHYGKSYKYRQRFIKDLCKRAGIKSSVLRAIKRRIARFLSSIKRKNPSVSCSAKLFACSSIEQ